MTQSSKSNEPPEKPRMLTKKERIFAGLLVSGTRKKLDRMWIRSVLKLAAAQGLDSEHLYNRALVNRREGWEEAPTYQEMMKHYPNPNPTPEKLEPNIQKEKHDMIE